MKSSRVNFAAVGQPLCTALQLSLIKLLDSWNIKPLSVVGHSSGEIAAGYACGAITFESALTVAYHRGRLASTMLEKDTKIRGAMMAVGLSEADTQMYIAQIPEGKGKAVVACINSPRGVTVSGDRTAIIALQSILEARQFFVRRLSVRTAYHSHHMDVIAESYLAALQDLPMPQANHHIAFYSSVTGDILGGEQLDAAYWTKNMVSHVRFAQALQTLCRGTKSNDADVGPSWEKPAVDLFVEIGPHSALAGVCKQNCATLQDTKPRYMTCLVRETDAVQTIMALASRLWVNGVSVDLNAVQLETSKGGAQVLVDLPPYPWDHGVSYWHESRLSIDFRMRSAPRHPLLGAPSQDFNILEPSWRNVVRVSEIPWIRGHVVQSNIVYPAAGYVAMAIEASLQRSRLNGGTEVISKYRLRNVNIGRTLFIPDDTEGIETVFKLRPFNQSVRQSSDLWDEFCVFSYTKGEGWAEHCRGLIRVEYHEGDPEVEGDRELQQKITSHQRLIEEAKSQCQDVVDPGLLYDTLRTMGLGFGDPFRCIETAAVSDEQSLGTICIPNTAMFMPSGSEHPHVLHPATLDACLQMTCPSLMQAGALQEPMVPNFIEEMSVSADVTREPGQMLLVHTHTTMVGKREFKATVRAMSKSRDSSSLPMLDISGLTCTTILGGKLSGQDIEDGTSCHNMQWVPDPDPMEEQFQEKMNGVGVATRTSADRPKVVMIVGSSASAYAASVMLALSNFLKNVGIHNFEDIAAAGIDGKVCICFTEIDGAMLHCCTEAQWASIRSMLSSASSVLWITRGGSMESTSPQSGLITGLARSARTDNPALCFVTLDLDPHGTSPDGAASAIVQILDKSFGTGAGKLANEAEFAERAGRILIPRVMEKKSLYEHIAANTTFKNRTQPFMQTDRILRLEVGTPGLLDSLHFVEDKTALLPLAADELRMTPMAYGVNFRDIMISPGQLEGSSRMSSEHAGVVTEVGECVKDQFRVGDRICAWGGTAYASSTKVSGLAAQKIPDGMNFETAASIPIVYVTAYYSLVHLARLQKGETVLIHSAAGGVGQAAVMLALHLGVKVFVTVGSNKKKALMMERFKGAIPEENIFSSRRTTFVDGIRRLTDGEGVNVVLNSIAGEALHETCRCVKALGRFIEIGKRDILSKARLDLDMFNRNVMFASVDLGLVFEHDLGLAGRMLGEIFNMLQAGAISPVSPISTFRLSEIESAFRLIQAGKHVGKVVLTVEPDTEVKVGFLPHILAIILY